MSRSVIAVFLVSLAWEGHPAPAQQRQANLVLRGGKIATLEAGQPYVEAIAIRGDRIVAVGDDDSIGEHIGESTRVIELDGRFACPGFIEGHGHFLSLGQSKRTVDLSAARSWPEVCEL